MESDACEDELVVLPPRQESAASDPDSAAASAGERDEGPGGGTEGTAAGDSDVCTPEAGIFRMPRCSVNPLKARFPRPMIDPFLAGGKWQVIFSVPMTVITTPRAPAPPGAASGPCGLRGRLRCASLGHRGPVPGAEPSLDHPVSQRTSVGEANRAYLWALLIMLRWRNTFRRSSSLRREHRQLLVSWDGRSDHSARHLSVGGFLSERRRPQRRGHGCSGAPAAAPVALRPHANHAREAARGPHAAGGVRWRFDRRNSLRKIVSCRPISLRPSNDTLPPASEHRRPCLSWSGSRTRPTRPGSCPQTCAE